MNYKNNPWLSLVALLLAALILVLTCTGCTEADAAETETRGRFTVEYAGDGCRIITDNETGVQYMFYYYSDYTKRAGGGLCKLED